jgi:hypothetical protein
MTRITVLALSKWAHFSWLPRGERAITERAQADANADLLARFPQLAAMQTKPAMPPFAALPRPACAKVLRVTAALAHARLLRRVVSAEAQKIFAVRIAPHVLHAIQRDLRGDQEDVDQGMTLNVLDRAEMTAAGLRVALRAIDDPSLRVLMELRLPRTVVQHMTHFGVGDTPIKTAHDLLDAAYTLARGEAC